ncbi:histidine phosphatase family protein [Streptomyces sp. NPDC004111]|uniref:histidine phosphatase family protein n=1 Tax=Streptomyces sp. NPDC004111 TaxID=3364690 RepID=UPI00367C6B5C
MRPKRHRTARTCSHTRPPASDHASHTACLELVFGWPTDPTTLIPGGESGTAVLQRFDSVVEEAVRSGARTVAIVSHGVVIRVWIALRAAGVTARDVQPRELDNAGIVILGHSAEGAWHPESWDGLPAGPGASDPWGGGPTGKPLQGCRQVVNASGYRPTAGPDRRVHSDRPFARSLPGGAEGKARWQRGSPRKQGACPSSEGRLLRQSATSLNVDSAKGPGCGIVTMFSGEVAGV